MPVDLTKSLVIGISSRALFDLEESNKLFETEGENAYTKYQEERKDEPLKPGIGFRLVQAILGLNSRIREKGVRKAEVVVTSRNSPATSIRLFHSIEHHKLDIQRAILTSGTPVARYLKPFCVDLYLSAYEKDVEEAIRAGIAAAVIYQNRSAQVLQQVVNQAVPPAAATELVPAPVDPCEELRIAFDGDNVLFDSEAEDVYQKGGLTEFLKHEVKHSKRPLSDGPFAKFLRTLAVLQKDPSFDRPPLRTALVTARNLPAHLRVLNTFQSWGIHVDEAFFMGGVDKSGILAAFQPHIFFDDQEGHCRSASKVVSTARVPVPREAAVCQPAEMPKPSVPTDGGVVA
jgi:5'-nucleotidase